MNKMLMLLILMGGLITKSLILNILILTSFLFILFHNFLSLNGLASSNHMIILDNLNLMMIILTIWVTSLILSMKHVWQNKTQKLLIQFIMSSLILCFLMNKMFWFFIFFELVLVPMLMLILLYGTYLDRLESGLYMLFYTMTGSLPLFMMIINLKNQMFSWDFLYLKLMKESILTNPLTSSMFLLAFLSKLPMYGFHIWLPKAHVQAPPAGSMILAGILLKLGSYGLLRFSFLLEFNLIMKALISMASLLGSLICSLVCLRQNDFKKLVAYSSIIHMGFIPTSILTFSEEAYMGSLMMSICHGLTSSALFLMVGMIQNHMLSRSIMLIKGSLSTCPSLSLWIFLFLILNMGCPPFLSFLSEILLCSSLMKWSLWTSLILSPILFFSVLFNMSIYSLLTHGEKPNIFVKPMKMSEHLLLFLHFAPSISFITKLEMFCYL